MQVTFPRYGFLGLMLLCTACTIGTPESPYLSARGPSAELKLKMGIKSKALGKIRNQRLTHELLALQEDGVLVLVRDKIALIDYNALLSYSFSGKKLIFRKKYQPETVRSRITGLAGGQINLLTRFPQGVSDSVMHALLRAHNQDTLIRVSR
ncbi:MAG: hypothetical protein AAF564_03240 [Bacteroidota bacterium]